jgi:NADH:ubiquinone oxidoreductase subunit 2 (subunit N)
MGAVNNRLYWLVIIAVINSVIAAYYYLRVVYVMYMQREREEVFKLELRPACSSMRF